MGKTYKDDPQIKFVRRSQSNSKKRNYYEKSKKESIKSYSSDEYE